MENPCYTLAMRRNRGLALIASMLLAMSVLLIVTVMFATMKTEFQVSRLSGEQLSRYYMAKAATAEVVVKMGQTTSWQAHLNGTPMTMSGYDPPVEVYLQNDLTTPNLIHIRADCQGQQAYRVVRDASRSDAMVFLGASDTAGQTNFFRMARRHTGKNNESDLWKSMLPPPPTVFAADGTLTAFSGDVVESYAADFQGKFYSVLSGPEGFAMYSSAGSTGWERLPPRPEARFAPTGTTLPGGSYSGSTETPVFDAAKDGTSVWFVENVAPGAGLPEGASYIQKYDPIQKTWSLEDVPRQYALSPDGHFQVDQVALGDNGEAFLLTKPTAGQQARILGLDTAGNWGLIDAPPANYLDRAGQVVRGAGTLEVESIAVGPSNELFVTAPTGMPDWYAAPSFDGVNWGMGIDSEGLSVYRDRNFANQPRFRGISTDSAGDVVVGSQARSMQGTALNGFQKVPDLPPSVVDSTSKVGGGLRALPNSGYSTTAEY